MAGIQRSNRQRRRDPRARHVLGRRRARCRRRRARPKLVPSVDPRPDPCAGTDSLRGSRMRTGPSVVVVVVWKNKAHIRVYTLHLFFFSFIRIHAQSTRAFFLTGRFEKALFLNVALPRIAIHASLILHRACRYAAEKLLYIIYPLNLTRSGIHKFHRI